MSTPGLGIGIGGGLVDEDCTAREDARSLAALGLNDEAVLRLCQRPEMKKALGSRCPAEYVPTPKARRAAPEAQQAAYSGPTYEEAVQRCRNVPDLSYASCMRDARNMLQ